MNTGNIPVLVARGKSLADMWENSMLELYQHGAKARTQYDRKDKEGEYIDPPSIDCTMMMVCEDPFSDPMIHRAFPGGLEDLEEYRMEVVDGIKDHWVRDKGDPTDERWEYTYHGRWTHHPVINPPYFHKRPFDVEKAEFNQLIWLVDKLGANPITRRAIAHTWVVGEDNGYESPPCTQGLWLRGIPREDGVVVINMDVRFRSRDAYDAAFMNAFAFVYLQKWVADELSRRYQMETVVGRYVDFSDSYHIYGRRIADFEERFLKLLYDRSFEERTWPLEFAQPLFDEARPKILEKVRRKDERDARG